MIILNRAEIEALIDPARARAAIEAAYVAASRAQITLPPVGHITFGQLGGDCHIKYGHAQGDAHFVIKVATGFPLNSAAGLPTGNGVSLVMSAQTGALEAVLHDEMVMTDIRTGIGGAIASRRLARAGSTRVLVVGTGPQALRQIESHAAVFGPDVSFDVWGRARHKAEAAAARMAPVCRIRAAGALRDAVACADIVVTATGSTQPLIDSAWVRAGTHITAVGADAPGKQELAPELVARADVQVADLAEQCLDHGELSHAYRQGLIGAGQVVTLGAVLAGDVPGRAQADQITIADLTGIAAQDIAIANTVLDAYHRRTRAHGNIDGNPVPAHGSKLQE